MAEPRPIKSNRSLTSDIPLISKQRSPAYKAGDKSFGKPKFGEIDIMSRYVERNLKKAVKPRGSEYR
jgi:hypothetical protein